MHRVVIFHPVKSITDESVTGRILLALTEHERELILLRYVNEVSVADLSEIYNVSRFAMYRKLKGVLKKLKNSMQG